MGLTSLKSPHTHTIQVMNTQQKKLLSGAVAIEAALHRSQYTFFAREHHSILVLEWFGLECPFG